MNTTPIKGMRTEILEMMARKYGKGRVPAPASPEVIENAHFVRSVDATAISKVCKGAQLTVSFREAGVHTIRRIKEGNPCKGHTILDKSIKEQGEGYTYGGLDSEQFEHLCGLVGYPGVGDNANPPVLGGVWVLEAGKPIRGGVDLGALALGNAFTGDYDIHDLIKKGERILAGTPDEESAIEALNNAMLRTDQSNRPRKLDADLALIATARQKEKDKIRLRESSYALIRHGAQTSYISFLLGPGASELTSGRVTIRDSQIPDQDKISNISSKICVFHSDGNAYILSSVNEVYAFYAANKLLNQVPFYYFFKDLMLTDDEATRTKVGVFANEILRKWGLDSYKK